MLDDLKYIAMRDKSDALGVAEKQPAQLMYEFDVSFEPTDISNVVVAGMGGSAIAANMSLNWPQPKVPVVVSRNYVLPPFADAKTLCVLSSYSGETEEVLSAMKDAQERNCQIVVITDGGQLEAAAREHGYPFAKIPGGIQPRLAVWYMFRALLEIFDAAGLSEGSIDELESTVEFLEEAAQQWRPDVPTSNNYAKQLAEEIAGKTPVIYAGAPLSSAAYKWKINCNENAKNIAFWNVLPEVNHNEMIGWSSHPIQKPFAPIELISDLYHPQLQKRFEIMNRVLSGRMPHPIEIQLGGSSILEQLLWAILLGDFVSIYLGLINNVDPTQVDMMQSFKKQITLDDNVAA